MALSKADTERLNSLSTAFYMDVLNGKPSAASASALLKFSGDPILNAAAIVLDAAAGASNPIRDVPPAGFPRLTDAKAVLDRAREFNVRWEGGSTALVSLADVADARRRVAAWGGDTPNLGMIKLEAPNFYEGIPIEERQVEAKRRHGVLHQAGADLVEYWFQTGTTPRELDPEPGVGAFFTPCAGPNEWAGFDLAAYIAEQIKRAASGSASGVGSPRA